MCTIIPIEVCHLLLGRRWQFDHRSIHDGAKNTHSFLYNGRKLILEPLKPPDIETTMCTTFLAEARESGMFFSLTSHEKNKYAKKPKIETTSPVQAAPSTTMDIHDASSFMPVMAYSTSSSTEDLFVGEGGNMELNCVGWDSPPIFYVCPEEDHDSFLDTPPIFDEYRADESEFCVTTPSLSGNLFVEYADPVWEDFDINYTRLFSYVHLKLQLKVCVFAVLGCGSIPIEQKNHDGDFANLHTLWCILILGSGDRLATNSIILKEQLSRSKEKYK
ncbi:hypothetical protein IFM89_002374 [Coptis chinensis]|uniref:Uncharacterized protein n=1 Tax=Coptis chinensis TaxID=261450 RepID=A0A835IK90_9MAGN|nr:hypothetical protein IFM89_002374 [Coptis chinensis]